MGGHQGQLLSEQRRVRQSVQFRIGLLQPKSHVHLPVHRRRGREFVAGLIRPAGVQLKFSEAVMATRDERAHAEFAGQRERLPVMAFGLV
jgi:hypothetical protein